MTLFPAFLKLESRLVVIIGGGSIATQKIPALLHAGARVRVIAPRLSALLIERVRRCDIDWHPKPFEPEDLFGAFLVIAATSIAELNATVFAEAERRNILCNSVDDVDHCHFYYGSVVQRGDLQIAISTNGKSPALAQRLRRELEQQFGPEYALWLAWLGAAREVLRSQWEEAISDPESTKRFLHLLASRPGFEEFLRQARSNSNNEGVS
jgi:siroheme synthase-like protein